MKWFAWIDEASPLLSLSSSSFVPVSLLSWLLSEGASSLSSLLSSQMRAWLLAQALAGNRALTSGNEMLSPGTFCAGAQLYHEVPPVETSQW